MLRAVCIPGGKTVQTRGRLSKLSKLSLPASLRTVIVLLIIIINTRVCVNVSFTPSFHESWSFANYYYYLRYQ